MCEGRRVRADLAWRWVRRKCIFEILAYGYRFAFMCGFGVEINAIDKPGLCVMGLRHRVPHVGRVAFPDVFRPLRSPCVSTKLE